MSTDPSLTSIYLFPSFRTGKPIAQKTLTHFDYNGRGAMIQKLAH
ncbi:hypothetical protein [Acinetobacter gerneri]